MAVNLNDLIFNKDGKLTTGAKIGGAVAAAGGIALLLAANKKKNQNAAITTPTATVTAYNIPDPIDAQQPAKSNTGLYIGLGIGAIVVGVGIYFLAKK